MLRVGSASSALSAYGEDGDTKRLRFRLPLQLLAAVPDGTPVTVEYGHKRPGAIWDIGALRR